MADKVGLDSGSVPPQNIPPAQADASKAASPAGAGGAESPSQYFYEVAQSEIKIAHAKVSPVGDIERVF